MLTDEGNRALGLRLQSRMYIDGWLMTISLGQVEEAYMHTRPTDR